MKTFSTYEKVEGMVLCRKKPIVMQCKQMDEPFRAKSLEGDYAQGKAGDYLMQGTRGEHWVVDKEIFKETYDLIKGE